MRFRASTAGGLGLTLLCGSFMISGCASDSGGARNGATGSGGSAGSQATAGTGGSTAGTGGATAGTGGTATAGTGGTGGSVATVCPTPMAVEGNVISEFEGTTPTFGAAGEFAGGYYAYSDTAKGGTTTPDTSTPGTELMPVTGSHEGNGLHYAGTGFAADSWGAGFGVWITCADASTVDGVALWVKNDQPLRVAATIPGTQSASSGGECTALDCKANSFT
ncbi:MAG TPA: hypothetical protein VM686_42915, partial [Polyangiaceae bacterium]|nr:hypothetical protein [Polyangiaceae bacterium]